jgi:hypothetical protein
MSIIQRHIAEQEERLALIEEICINRGALSHDTETDEVSFIADEQAHRNAYAAVFQAWATGQIKGTVNHIFEAAKSTLEE